MDVGYFVACRCPFERRRCMSVVNHTPPTLGLIGSTSDLIEGKNTDIDGWLAAASAWNGEAKNMYSPKKQGRWVVQRHISDE